MYGTGIKGRWAVYLIMLALLVMPAYAQDDQPTPDYPFAIETFQDSAGRYATVYPADWQNESTPLYGHFNNGEGSAIYFLVVEGSEPRDTIPEAMRLIFPGFNRPIFLITQTPTPNGVWLQLIYRLDNGGLAMAMARIEHGASYILILVTPDQELFNDVAPVLGAAVIEMEIAPAVNLQNVLPAPVTDGVRTAIDDYINEAIDHFNVPGAAVAVVQGGRVVYQQTFGVRAVGSDASITPDTLFMTGAITEGMTTTMMAALVDAGVLDWDQPVVTLLPTFQLSDDRTEDMRVRDMVSHSAGLRMNDVPLYVFPFTAEQVIGSLVDNRFDADFGEQYTPNRQLFASGGYLAAIAAGGTLDNARDTYINLMQTYLFTPGGMQRTTFDFDAALADSNVALPNIYDPFSDTISTVDGALERIVVPVSPAYGAWSSLTDMAQFLIMQTEHGSLPDDVTIVSSAALTVTRTAHVALGADTNYGLGWFISEYFGQSLIYNGGSTQGYTSDLAFLPQSGFGIVILTNVGQAGNFTSAVRQHILEVVFGLPNYANPYYTAAEESRRVGLQQNAVQGEPIDREQVANFTGTYQDSVVFSIDDSEQFVVTTAIGEQTLLHVPNASATFMLANLPTIHVRFFENRDHVMTATFFSADDDSQTLELSRLES